MAGNGRKLPVIYILFGKYNGQILLKGTQYMNKSVIEGMQQGVYNKYVYTTSVRFY